MFMEEVVLIFATLKDMIRFLTDNNISHADVNLRENKIRMRFNEKIIELANI